MITTPNLKMFYKVVMKSILHSFDWLFKTALRQPYESVGASSFQLGNVQLEDLCGIWPTLQQQQLISYADPTSSGSLHFRLKDRLPFDQ